MLASRFGFTSFRPGQEQEGGAGRCRIQRLRPLAGAPERRRDGVEEVGEQGRLARAEDFRAKGADAILFASSSAVQSFADQAAALKLGPDAKRPLAGSIGPQTSETMKKVGMPIDFEAKTPNLDALVEALVKKLNRG